MKIYLNEEDRKKFTKLHETTLMTPVLNELWEFFGKLGKKYGFDPDVCVINTETGEVKNVEEGI